jgi:ubiquinone/menaquinone biosynthesis C-methylase UbiE
MENGETKSVRTSYDLVADEYARRIYDELQHKPLDRQLLDRFVAMVPKTGLVCDIGTGPGHVARYLNDRGLHVCGIDLSAEMVARARQLNPGIEFRRGNMFALDVPDGTFDAITGFYALVNIARPDIVRALRELRRVLKPGGFVLLAFHIGDRDLHRSEWWGAEVSLYFYFFRPDEMSGYLRAAGFEVGGAIERDPYPEIEQQTRRAYIFARKPS